VGASVAINGVCLTVTAVAGDRVVFTAVRETLVRTTLKGARSGDQVNLERALCASGRLDGHFVLGHVDGVGTIEADTAVGESIVRRIRAPWELRKLLARKGSVAVDGVSLTIADCRNDSIDISLIPQTLKETTLGIKNPGDEVNLECDVLARYLQRIIAPDTLPADAPLDSGSGEGGASLMDKLERAGF
jgi:riboflavin synthase